MSHDKNRNATFLGKAQQAARRLAHLADAAGCAGNAGAEHRLDRIDDHQGRPQIGGRLQNRFQTGFRQHPQFFVGRAGTAGPHPGLGRRLLARDIKHRTAMARKMSGRRQQQGRFADSRISADQSQGPGYDTTAEYAVQFIDPGRPAQISRIG